MRSRLFIMTLICIGLLASAAQAQMPKRLPAKSPKQKAQEYLKTPSQTGTLHSSDGVFDIKLKPSVPTFDYEEALKNADRKTPAVATVKRPQLVVGARPAQKRGIASANEGKIKLYRTKKRSR